MTLLIFGKTGQVARELGVCAPDAVFLDRQAADLMDPGACAARIAELRPSAVINAAAWTAVDAAEDNSESAFRVNADAPGAMAEAAAEIGAAFVQISSDYVFDGSGNEPWQPDDATGPLGVYGASKLAGEERVRASGATAAILRTSWVFSAHAPNFVMSMLRLAKTRDRLTVVADQIGGPTPADAIATACLRIASTLVTAPVLRGTYHFSGSPDVSWAAFAREIFARSGQSIHVEDIRSSDFPTKAARPGNSRLDCSKTEKVFGLARPDWRLSLTGTLSDSRVRQVIEETAR